MIWQRKILFRVGVFNIEIELEQSYNQAVIT
jgi:hypothetical protein